MPLQCRRIMAVLGLLAAVAASPFPPSPGPISLGCPADRPFATGPIRYVEVTTEGCDMDLWLRSLAVVASSPTTVLPTTRVVQDAVGNVTKTHRLEDLGLERHLSAIRLSTAAPVPVSWVRLFTASRALAAEFLLDATLGTHNHTIDASPAALGRSGTAVASVVLEHHNRQAISLRDVTIIDNTTSGAVYNATATMSVDGVVTAVPTLLDFNASTEVSLPAGASVMLRIAFASPVHPTKLYIDTQRRQQQKDLTGDTITLLDAAGRAITHYTLGSRDRSSGRGSGSGSGSSPGRTLMNHALDFREAAAECGSGLIETINIVADRAPGPVTLQEVQVWTATATADVAGVAVFRPAPTSTPEVADGDVSTGVTIPAATLPHIAWLRLSEVAAVTAVNITHSMESAWVGCRYDFADRYGRVRRSAFDPGTARVFSALVNSLSTPTVSRSLSLSPTPGLSRSLSAPFTPTIATTLIVGSAQVTALVRMQWQLPSKGFVSMAMAMAPTINAVARGDLLRLLLPHGGAQVSMQPMQSYKRFIVALADVELMPLERVKTILHASCADAVGECISTEPVDLPNVTTYLQELLALPGDKIILQVGVSAAVPATAAPLSSSGRGCGAVCAVIVVAVMCVVLIAAIGTGLFLWARNTRPIVTRDPLTDTSDYPESTDPAVVRRRRARGRSRQSRHRLSSDNSDRIDLSDSRRPNNPGAMSDVFSSDLMSSGIGHSSDDIPGSTGGGFMAGGGFVVPEDPTAPANPLQWMPEDSDDTGHSSAPHGQATVPPTQFVLPASPKEPLQLPDMTMASPLGPRDRSSVSFNLKDWDGALPTGSAVPAPFDGDGWGTVTSWPASRTNDGGDDDDGAAGFLTLRLPTNVCTTDEATADIRVVSRDAPERVASPAPLNALVLDGVAATEIGTAASDSLARTAGLPSARTTARSRRSAEGWH